MDYRKVYTTLVTKAKGEGRTKETGTYEAHHILPRSFGGLGDCRNHNHPNIVLLTPREHYLAHLLLVAIYPDSSAMKKALWNMCNVNPTGCRYKVGARMYNYIRTEYIQTCLGENNHFFGRKHSEETKKKIGAASVGRQANLGKRHTDQAKEKISQARLGTTMKPEVVEKIKASLTGGNHYNAKKIICINTGMVFGSGRELSEYTGVSMSTIRSYLNGARPKPETFHYKRA